ncbi:MAG: hypothetical protein IT164_11365 [Bryobacterales bacterium]|nr:hypothetical protein [Bryobacterales bacterium]
MTEPSALMNLVEAARRRALAHRVAGHAMTGACAALGGAALVLIAGSDLFDWRWLVLLFSAGAGWSAWRTMRSLPGPYEVAQEIDRRMELSDTLSTAYYFGGEDRRGQVNGELWRLQRVRAEEASRGLEAAAVFPWGLPRRTYLAGALIVGLSGLLMVRYGLLGTLDVRAPMVRGLSQYFTPGKERAGKKDGGGRKQGESPMSIPLDEQGEEAKELSAASPDALSEVTTPDVNAGVETRDLLKSMTKEIKAQAEEGDAMEEDAEGDRQARGEGKDGGSDSSESASPDGQKGVPQEAKNGQQGKEGNNSSLMDKMRDAMANLLAKMKLPQQGTQKQGGQQKGAQGGGEMQGKKGSQQKGQTQGKGSPADDAEGADEGQPSEQAQSGQGKGGDKGSEQQAQPSQQSGMGKQDGEKEIRDAEQARAMGKISEIFGKRAENMKGEMMVEVKSSRQQQLRTAYSDRRGAHRESGGEIHRDEVPLDLQHYVQQYFENVRKPGAGKAAREAK